jgi:hypothetical protein
MTAAVVTTIISAFTILLTIVGLHLQTMSRIDKLIERMTDHITDRRMHYGLLRHLRRLGLGFKDF